MVPYRPTLAQSRPQPSLKIDCCRYDAVYCGLRCGKRIEGCEHVTFLEDGWSLFCISRSPFSPKLTAYCGNRRDIWCLVTPMMNGRTVCCSKLMVLPLPQARGFDQGLKRSVACLACYLQPNSSRSSSIYQFV